MRRTFVAIALLLTIVACGPKRIVVPGPGRASPSSPALSLEDSTIQVPIAFPVAPIRTQLEQDLPSVLAEAEGAWVDLGPGKGWAKYRVWRDQLSVSMIGNTLALRTKLFFRAQFAKSAGPFGRITLGTCGHGDPPGSFDVEIRAALTLTPGWTVAVAPAHEVHEHGACKMTMFGIDVSPKVRPVVDMHVSRAAESLARRVREHPTIRSTAERAWNLLSTPIQVENGWLALNPNAIQVSSLNGSGDRVDIALGIVARPSIRFDGNSGGSGAPLPPAMLVPPGNGIHVALELTMPYSDLRRIMAERLQASPPTIRKQRLNITSVDVYPAADRLVIGITSRGKPLDGTVYLIGTPAYNANTAVLSVPDLDYDLQTRAVLPRLGDWLMHESIVEGLRQQAQWDFKDQISRLKAKAEAALNRDFSGVSLKGTLAAIRPLGHVVYAESVGVRVIFDGQASAVIK